MRSTVIVGASLGGLRTAEALRRGGDDGEIVLVGAEAHQPYDRPPLSKQVLDGSWPVEQATLRQARDLEVTWRLGVPASGLDLTSRLIALADGHHVGFDRLVIATGATPRTLPGTDGMGGVLTLRSLEDSLALAAALRVEPWPRLCVIGAGFIGSEVASVARSLGLEVTVLEAADRPLGRVLGPELAELCAGLHADAGVDLRLGAGVAALEDDGTGSVRRVRLSDGTAVEADVVVVGIGARPEVGWLAGSGVAIDDGVRCDAWLRVLHEDGDVVEDVVAVGDVARWDHPVLGHPVRSEHWTNAVEHAATAAATLLRGPEGIGHAPLPYVWSDQFGHKLQVSGHLAPDDEVLVVDGSFAERKVVALLGRDGVTVGVFAMDLPARMVQWRTRLVAGLAFPPPAPDPPAPGTPTSTIT